MQYIIGSNKLVVTAGLNGVTKTGDTTYTANVMTPYISTRECETVAIQGVQYSPKYGEVVPVGSALYSLPCNGAVYSVSFTSSVVYSQMALVYGPNSVYTGYIGSIKTVK